MRIGAILIALWCSIFLLAAPASGPWRPPQSIPAACPSIQFEAVLLDVSRSMSRDGFFGQSRAAIEDYISKAQPCTLLVLGSFGLTADVQDAQFLATPEGKARLIAVLHGLRATHTATNLDEAAKLVELLSYQLRAAYGDPANLLVVRVYSDFESSPSTGKSGFSLGEYLARRMDARYMRVMAGNGPGEQPQSGEEPAAVASTPLGPEKHSAPTAAFVLAGGGILLLGGLSIRLRRRARARGVCPPAGLDALLVTETTVALDNRPPAPGSPERTVPIAPGVPILFSTDPKSATYIAGILPNGVNGELFRIEPLTDGFIRVASPHPRLTVNNESLDVDRRRRVDLREPVTVRLGPREFHITGVFGRPRNFERADDIFDSQARTN